MSVAKGMAIFNTTTSVKSASSLSIANALGYHSMSKYHGTNTNSNFPGRSKTSTPITKISVTSAKKTLTETVLCIVVMIMNVVVMLPTVNA
ncbi:hypothetical protein ACFX2A_014387 [Malus domestica]